MVRQSNIRSQIKGKSKPLLDAIRRLERAARVHQVAILITGETGTGKELAARLVHEASVRQGPFVAFNCATVPKDLMDSELFGYARGAFSGANRDHPGLFEQADRGTLFLDEIGEMPAEMQAKVLRAIQEGEVRRVGDTRVRKVDVRIVTATHRDLIELVNRGGFRQDLLYRLKGYRVELPPLRDRGRDIGMLARVFLREVFSDKRISRTAEAMLLKYKWPGNIRELQNVVRAAAIDAGRVIEPNQLSAHIDGVPICNKGSSSADQILWIIDQFGAASSLKIRTETNIPKSTLQRAIAGLLDTGVLARVGNGPRTRYIRVKEQR